MMSTLQKSQAVQRIHLFHSMPVPLAFGLGMALGPFVDITVYNWERDQSTYFPVLRLNRYTAICSRCIPTQYQECLWCRGLYRRPRR